MSKPEPVKAHISGTVWKVEVQKGAKVKHLDTIVILESMKMEMPVESPKDGTVIEVKVEPNQFVNEGDVVAIVE